MAIVQRAYRGLADQQEMAALVHQDPAGNLHVADLPYRLSSWALDDPGNVGLWVDEGPRLVGWAVLQAPFWAIDYACHPAVSGQLHRQMLAWADGRARQVLGTPGGRPRWYVNVFAGQRDRIRDLEEAGFACQDGVDDGPWSKVLMRRDGRDPVAALQPPAGFAIRPLAGEGEVGAHVALQREVFESENMTAEWRARTLQRPEHIAEADLVAVAPDGRLAAFCLCWLDRGLGQATGQVEPLGVREEFRRLGLGQAVLAEGLRRLQRHGAAHVYVETDNYRDAAFALYEAMGFRVMREVLVYRKDYAPAQDPQSA